MSFHATPSAVASSPKVYANDPRANAMNACCRPASQVTCDVVRAQDVVPTDCRNMDARDYPFISPYMFGYGGLLGLWW